MHKILLIIPFSFLLPNILLGQSIHEEQSNYYNSLGNDNAWYEANTVAAEMPAREKSSCNLNKIVYGWHPYWSGNTYQNYDWDLISHFSYFSYEVDPASGNANTTHGFASSAAVTAAIASGNTKVTLCATMFGSSNNATFLANATAKQTLITNLINLVQSRGAHGVNIDFEQTPASQKTNFANFMVDLANQMHAAIPGSHVSTVLYAVDWSDIYDFPVMNATVDHFIIMGYDYYYGGSNTAGPTDPLFHFGNTYNYTLSRSVTYYLNKGCPKNKLVLGLPFYGREWKTQTTTIPSSTIGTGTAVLFKNFKANANGYYSNSNLQFDADSYSEGYTFNNGTNNKQMFISNDIGFRKRLELINNTGLAGLGIWALGQDDGYNTYWSAVEDYLTDCATQSCPGSIHDFGGPTKDYYANENYTWTIAPPNAGSLTLTFSSFDTENNFDKLYIYDGPTTSSPQIAGSPFSGSAIPPVFTSSLGALTFKFTSDGADQRAGFNATYTCANGSSLPTTAINSSNVWQTSNFSTTFNDQDNVAVADSFYLVSDNNGTEWRANQAHSYLYEKFDLNSLHTDWSSHVGTWNLVSNELKQTDESSANTNISIPLTQNNQSRFLYEWKGKIEGTGTNRRFGMHFFSDDATQSNRNNSYLVYWYPDQGKCRLHKATGNTLNFITETNVSFNASNWYNFKVLYNPTTGEIKTFLDNNLVLTHTDSSPLQSGNSISFRTGEATAYLDDIKVYKSRGANVSISLGSSADEIRYQNQNPSFPSAKIESIVIDGSNNWSATVSQLENIDWTAPSSVVVNDGPNADLNSFSTPSQIQANWTTSTDSESGLLEYSYAIGTTSGATDIVPWTNNATSTSFTHTGLSLISGTTYYTSVKVKNNALLESTIITSDGQTLQGNTTTPTANFTYSTTSICMGDTIHFTNTSTNSTTYSWSFGNGNPASSSLENPSVVFPGTGTYSISLVSVGSGGTANTTQTINIIVAPAPVSAFSPLNNPIYLPNATAYFTNNSTNGSHYSWDFGNGTTSTDFSPWATYTSTGTYTTTLITSNGTCGSDTSTVEIEVLPPVSVEENKYVSGLSIYPNPIKNDLTIGFYSKINSPATITLYNALGALVKQNINIIKLGANKISPFHNINDLPKGIYTLKIKIKESTISKKILKE